MRFMIARNIEMLLFLQFFNEFMMWMCVIFGTTLCIEYSKVKYNMVLVLNIRCREETCVFSFVHCTFSQYVRFRCFELFETSL